MVGGPKVGGFGHSRGGEDEGSGEADKRSLGGRGASRRKLLEKEEMLNAKPLKRLSPKDSVVG